MGWVLGFSFWASGFPSEVAWFSNWVPKLRLGLRVTGLGPNPIFSGSRLLLVKHLSKTKWQSRHTRTMKQDKSKPPHGHTHIRDMHFEFVVLSVCELFSPQVRQCAWWNERLGTNGAWDPSACTTVSTGIT